MSTELVNITGSALTAIMHGEGGLIPQPFASTVLLLNTFVTGTFFVKGVESLAEKIQPGERLTLVREPANRYDKYAILVNDSAGNKLGYIPRRNNVILANLMDAGKCVYAKLTRKSNYYSSLDLSISVFMEE